MSFIEELKRRNVVRMVALYAVASWLMMALSFLGITAVYTLVHVLIGDKLIGK